MQVVKANESGLVLAVRFLRLGKSVVFPTDTSYGLAVDATHVAAVKKLYKVKGRDFKKPVHVVVDSLAMAKKLVNFNAQAEILFKKFLPGPLTLVLKSKVESRMSFKLLSAGTGNLGIRMPDNEIALFLTRGFGRPITATSANRSGGGDCYGVSDVLRQFRSTTNRPDLILDTGNLKRNKPSTVVAVVGEHVTILRQGPISKRLIYQALS